MTFYSKVSPAEGIKLTKGYAEIPTYRTLMAYLYEEGGEIHEEIPLDGVGTYLQPGTSLIVVPH